MSMHQSGTWQNKMLGRYRLLRLLGRGGMGEVWLAEDTQLRRHVAVKLLPTVFQSDRNYLEDFEREAQAAAALEHPHILPIHDFGEQRITEDEVVTYLITPYITGGSLLNRIRAVNGPLPPLEAISYLRQAAEAIDYAHSHNILHRDIKPANMLLQEGWLFLADFGIAKLLTSTVQRSRTFAGSGTPEYMAPEQARGKAEPASDRYSFAMTAYQLCTGQVPFQGNTPYDTLIKQMTAEPPSPRQLNPALPQAVEQALLQGLAKQPQDRPESCMALVRALERGWRLNGQAQGKHERTSTHNPYNEDLGATSVPTRNKQAYETPQLYAQPLLSSTPSTIPPAQQTAVTPSPVKDSSQWGTEPAAESLALPTTPHLPPSHVPAPAAAPPQSQRKIPRRTVLVGGTMAALVAVGGTAAFYALQQFDTVQNHPTPRPNHLASHPTTTPGPKNLVPGVPLLSLTGHMQGVSVARWDPTGRYLATAGEDTYVMLWDITAALQKGSTSLQSIASPMRRWKLASPILTNGLCWSADGQTLAVVTGENKVFLYNAFDTSGTPQVYQDASTAQSANPPVHTSIAWSPTANTFATPAYVPKQTQQQIDLWRTGQTSAPIRVLASDATGQVRSLIIDDLHPYNAPVNVDMIGWSPDGRLLAGHTNFGTVTIWQATTGTISGVLHLPTRPSTENPTYVFGESIAWFPGNSSLLAASDLDIATLWNVQQNKLLLTLKTTDPVPFLTALSWAPNGKYLAGSYAQTPRIYIWDVQTAATNTLSGKTQPQKLFFPQPGVHVHTATITDISWSPDGRYIASTSGDTTIVVWQVSTS